MKFLQISDIHYAYQNFDSHVMRNKLIEFLKIQTDIEVLFITGDIAHKGKFNSDVTFFLERIIDLLHISKESIFIVPGNHDIERNDERLFLLNAMYSQKKENYSDFITSGIPIKLKTFILMGLKNITSSIRHF